MFLNCFHYLLFHLLLIFDYFLHFVLVFLLLLHFLVHLLFQFLNHLLHFLMLFLLLLMFPLSFKNTTVPVIAIAVNIVTAAIAIMLFMFSFPDIYCSPIFFINIYSFFYFISRAFNISLSLFPFVHVIKVISLIESSSVFNMLTSFGFVINLL